MGETVRTRKRTEDARHPDDPPRRFALSAYVRYPELRRGCSDDGNQQTARTPRTLGAKPLTPQARSYRKQTPVNRFLFWVPLFRALVFPPQAREFIPEELPYTSQLGKNSERKAPPSP